MLGSISRALEERDQMQGHGARVTALAEPVARRLGWDLDRLAALRVGAPLHDIGKVAIRPELLRKSGPLTLEERAEIQVHPTAGAALVVPMRTAREALPYVLFHHERWDGGGYPSGLRGRAIPLEARLIAVADAFDAMTSARPYRQALTTDRALAEIAICAGTQFDPMVAEAFLEVWAVDVADWPAALAS
ncbi:MAG TPA: HD-GYP domain-containing protein [Gaiellaceae bacterium]|jgi:HD-GYP domain-containing protein (c-di-GMP phosphodiesterase class II)|nr:HD-GYP domain-containing protein [Gaiellaceae bacterium]